MCKNTQCYVTKERIKAKSKWPSVDEKQIKGMTTEQCKPTCIVKERYPWYSIRSKTEEFVLLVPFMILDILVIPLVVDRGWILYPFC